jgi:hypothetical protein
MWKMNHNVRMYTKTVCKKYSTSYIPNVFVYFVLVKVSVFSWTVKISTSAAGAGLAVSGLEAS